jgi:hypothetical protein
MQLLRRKTTPATLVNAVGELQYRLCNAGIPAVQADLYRVVKVADKNGVGYALVMLPEKSFPRDAESDLPSRIRKVEIYGLECLASFVEQGDAWQYRDEDLFRELVNAAAENGWNGSDCRSASLALCLGILARRGATNVKPWDVPL